MSEPPNPEVAVFAAALELPADQRGAYLAQACAGDADLRQQVEALLRVHDDAGSFFEKLAPMTRPASGQRAIPLAKMGDRIGRYKLLQQIGEGGCGLVYMAEQEEPVRRKVALKVIKLGMDTKSVIARFEAERQALALMDHPNIAKVLDAGATETGRPYFVMELVRGIKITDYCDQHNLSTRERLDLFIQVCQAIQHAHQKGIIHRDIKPSNILVADNDGVPMTKIIDFGIAKATTDQRLTDKTLFTAFEQFIGTPAYMSPEQAKLSWLDIDTRSDIYSLGVLLYELLTGRTPFDTKELVQAGLDEIRRVIQEQEPARPSTCLSTMLGADLTAIAKHRKADPPKLIHLVQGDLDWIVMKSLEKDRARRYETAYGLAADIQRHLSNEPVVACPPSNFYRFQKMIRRNRLVVAATTAVVGSSVVGLGASTWFLCREKQALQEAGTAKANEAVLREKLRESVRQYAEVQARFSEQQPAEDAGAIEQRTYDELAKELGVDVKLLEDKLPQFAREIKNAPDTAPVERAKAAYLTQDYAAAIKGFRDAAEAGNTEAQSRLGYLYEHGLGAPTNYQEAIKWYRLAAEAGNSDGRCALGWMYEHDEGRQDYQEAIKWYRLAADAGDNRGRDALGWMYEHGEGRQDYQEAIKWYRLAADAGDNAGRRAMGWMNEQGLGVERDLAEAARWDSKAADEGDARGREDLARVILAAKAAKEGEKLLVAHAPMWTISGVVLADDTGKPISNALVRVASPGINMRGVRDHREGVLDGRTDAEGRFNVQAPLSEKISLNAFAPGYEEAVGPWMGIFNSAYYQVPFHANQNQDFTIKLRPALFVTGVVVDESGRSFAGARVEATLCDETSTGYLAWDETDANGRFTIFDFSVNRADFSGNAKTRGQLTFEHSTMLKTVVNDVYALREMERRNIRVTLRRGHDVTGVLTSSDGQPLTNTLVEAVPSDRTAAPKMNRTDEHGRFVIWGLPDGEATLRSHSSGFEQRAQTTIHLRGANAEVNLHLEPVVFTNSPTPVTLLGMKLVDVTAEVQGAYDLYAPTGVMILDPGTNSNRLGIGWRNQGERFWMVGSRPIKNLREMVTELLRISEIEHPRDPNEGSRDHIRVVYDFLRGAGTYTDWLKLTEEDIAELKKSAATFPPDGAGE